VYEKVDDIDLMVGGVGETNVRGGAVGPTFACIIGEQFRRLKYGDRFFYTHNSDLNQAVGLSSIAKSFVLKRTLGDIICDNTKIEATQKWVTLQPDKEFNPPESCNKKRSLHLESVVKEITKELSRQSRSSPNRVPRGPNRSGRNLDNKGPLSPSCLLLGGCDKV